MPSRQAQLPAPLHPSNDNESEIAMLLTNDDLQDRQTVLCVKQLALWILVHLEAHTCKPKDFSLALICTPLECYYVFHKAIAQC
jgi:hypothetical protein